MIKVGNKIKKKLRKGILQDGPVIINSKPLNMFKKRRLTLCHNDKYVKYSTQKHYRFNRSFHLSICRQRVYTAVQV